MTQAYLRARYYDSVTVRFVSEDPAMDGTNWYIYAGNNPVMFFDPWGYTQVYLSFLAHKGKCKGKKISYLADVEKQVQELFDRLIMQQAEREGITEKLKTENQMEWVGRMNGYDKTAKMSL